LWLCMILNTMIQGDGPPLVLLHGLFGAAKNLGVVARGLSTQARVISMDLRNHGESPHSSVMNFPVMAADVVETCAALGVTQARVLGHSMGGKTAMALALTQPNFVERLVVMDIAPVTYNHGYDDFTQAMQAVPLSPSLTRHEADAVLARAVESPAIRAFLLNNLILGDTPHWRLGLDEITAAMPGLLAWEDFPGAVPYTGPALFLHGGDSNYVRPSANAAIQRLFPNAERETVEGASHWMHADKPKQVIASLKRFLFP
jgi:esterase